MLFKAVRFLGRQLALEIAVRDVVVLNIFVIHLSLHP